MSTQTTDSRGKLGKGAIIAYGCGGAATTLAMAFKNRFAMNFMTDIAGVSAAAIGTWMMLITIFDAINDPIIGGMADRTNSKWGKYRPWMIFGSFAVAIVLIMQFTNPNLGNMNLAYFIGVMILFSLAFTSMQASWQALNSTMASDPDERNLLLASRQFLGLIASNAIGIVTIPAVAFFGGGSQGWQRITIIFGIVVILCMNVAAFGARKRDYKGSIPDPKPMNFMESVKLVLTNRAAVCGGLGLAGFQLARAVLSAADMYYYKYVANDLTIIASAATFTLILNFVCVPLMPKLVRMLGKKNSAALGLILHMARPIMTMVLGVTMTRSMIVLAVILTFLGNMVSNFALLSMIPDCTDYTEYKYGTCTAGMLNAAMTFLQKLGGSFSTFIVGMILSNAGYVAVQGAAPEITPAITRAIMTNVTLVPMIITALTLIALYFYPITDAFGKQMRAELAQRRAAQNK